MKTRCKPGDIAIVLTKANLGKLVTVIRPYVAGEKVGGTVWIPRPGVMWVVEALGSPIKGVNEDGITFHTESAFGDSQLRPLRDQRGEDQMLRLTGKPQGANKVTAQPVKGAPHA